MTKNARKVSAFIIGSGDGFRSEDMAPHLKTKKSLEQKLAEKC